MNEINRYNLYPSAAIQGAPAAGYSSGQAIKAIQEVAAETLPRGYDIGWEGLSYDEAGKGNLAVYIFLIVVVFVYLVLVGQYESFILPLAVILSLPVGLFGSFLFLKVMGLSNDVYAQIGLVMLVGLLGKNAILIVEFAVQRRREGLSLKEAAIEGGKLRFRPILMTSFAFIAGLLPLVVATGPGAIGNRTIGTTAVGGMLVGTLIGVLVIPGLYYIFGKISDGRYLLKDEVDEPLTEKINGHPLRDQVDEPLTEKINGDPTIASLIAHGPLSIASPETGTSPVRISRITSRTAPNPEPSRARGTIPAATDGKRPPAAWGRSGAVVGGRCRACEHEAKASQATPPHAQVGRRHPVGRQGRRSVRRQVPVGPAVPEARVAVQAGGELAAAGLAVGAGRPGDGGRRRGFPRERYRRPPGGGGFRCGGGNGGPWHKRQGDDVRQAPVSLAAAAVGLHQVVGPLAAEPRGVEPVAHRSWRTPFAPPSRTGRLDPPRRARDRSRGRRQGQLTDQARPVLADPDVGRQHGHAAPASPSQSTKTERLIGRGDTERIEGPQGTLRVAVTPRQVQVRDPTGQFHEAGPLPRGSGHAIRVLPHF